MAEAYDAALRRRLDQINGMGAAANAYASGLAQQRAAQASQYYLGQPNVSQSSGPPSNGDMFGRFISAISGRESGGNYRARNPDSGALGRYQIMPGNVAPWSREALGRSISPNQFYNSPSLQDQIARFKLQQYVRQFGYEGAAVAWYAGPGTAKKYLASGGRGYNARQGKYSSISAYALGILRQMGLR